MESPEEQSFAANLPHRFPAILEQVRNGLFVVRRLASFIRKVSNATNNYVLEMEKAVKKEILLQSTFQQDRMDNHVEAVIFVHSLISTTNARQKQYAAKLHTQVIDPLQDFFDSAEGTFKTIASDYAAAYKRLENMKDSLKKKRAAAMAAWKLMTSTYRAKENPNTTLPKKTKLTMKIENLTPKTTQTFSQFETAYKECQACIADHYERIVPDLIKRLQAIEVQRLFLLQKHLAAFSKALFGLEDSNEDLMNDFMKKLVSLDTYTDIEHCIKQYVEQFGRMEETPPVPVRHLPCKSGDLFNEDWIEFLQYKDPKQPEDLTALNQKPSSMSRMTSRQSQLSKRRTLRGFATASNYRNTLKIQAIPEGQSMDISDYYDKEKKNNPTTEYNLSSTGAPDPPSPNHAPGGGPPSAPTPPSPPGGAGGGGGGGGGADAPSTASGPPPRPPNQLNSGNPRGPPPQGPPQLGAGPPPLPNFNTPPPSAPKPTGYQQDLQNLRDSMTKSEYDDQRNEPDNEYTSYEDESWENTIQTRRRSTKANSRPRPNPFDPLTMPNDSGSASGGQSSPHHITLTRGDEILLSGLYDFRTDDPEDLTFEAGDIIELIAPLDVDWNTVHEGDPVWCEGQLIFQDGSKGDTGSFPSNYVSLIV